MPSSTATPLGNLVMSGENQQAAIAVNDFIFMSQDVSNCYLVASPSGDVLINTGTVGGAERHKKLLGEHRQGPLSYVILTQGHPDHFGGVPLLREGDTQVVMQRNVGYVRGYLHGLKPFFNRRTHKLWAPILGQVHIAATPQEPQPDVTFDRDMAFEAGGRRFELYSTPGGETVDSLIVWLPRERVVFTGNLFGPVFMHVPNLYTLRGDRIRSAVQFIEDVDRVRALKPDLLVTGHGEPIRGEERIAADLTRLRDGVEYLHDATVAGMNAGKEMHALMREIKLPESLQLGEWHGKVSWAVRAIWEEYVGWFTFGSTTEIYDVPFKEVAGDIVELAGGPDRLASRAQQFVDRKQPLHALHLLDIALNAEPRHIQSLHVKQAALEQLQVTCGDENLSETMWLKSEIAAVRQALQ
jgi:alkyl sulfatase BDS1-like metallo-beta-lactamase superfamily hydrolase